MAEKIADKKDHKHPHHTKDQVPQKTYDKAGHHDLGKKGPEHKKK